MCESLSNNIVDTISNKMVTPIADLITNFDENKLCWTQESTLTQTQNIDMKWEENDQANFLCRYCNKTFYNTVALKNHQKLQHDGEAEDDGDASALSATYNLINQAFADAELEASKFRFVPLATAAEDPSIVREDGLTSRVFSRDTTYVVLRLDAGDAEAKRRRLDAVVRRAPLKPKSKPVPAVDLRGPFTCTFPLPMQAGAQCRQMFYNCCEYSLHYREEHTKRRKAALRCQVCEKRLDRDDLQLPPMAPVAPPPSFSCRHCQQTFRDSAHFDEHNRLVHAKMKPHQCSICAKRFTQQGGLQQHIRMHTGIRPFACTYCPKAFTQKAGLDQHMRTHTKVKPFKCVICGKCFSQSVHLRQHMRTHTNIQPFQCSLCGRRFKQTSHLNFHMRSHGATTPGLVVDRYAQEVAGGADFLELTNVQPVLDGETLYYAAELTLSGQQQSQQQYQQQQQQFTFPATPVSMSELSLNL